MYGTRRGLTGSYSFSPPPHHLLFILLIVLLFLVLSWYLSYEPVLESTMEQLNLLVMVLPLIILLAVRWLSSMERPPTISLPRSHPNAIHSAGSAGSSPWGVGLLLILLLVMISYQSAFHDQWFPLWTRKG